MTAIWPCAMSAGSARLEFSSLKTEKSKPHGGFEAFISLYLQKSVPLYKVMRLLLKKILAGKWRESFLDLLSVH